MEGKTVGHFRILREIGRGGKGIVYLAEDTRLKRRVAIKFLRTGKFKKKQLLKEARLAGMINHPGVVTVHDVIDNPEGVFIVMEYVDGESLDLFLKHHRLDLPFALRLAKEITQIVAAAHRQGLIHGDLKPGNILITPDGTPKLLDFGLAAMAAESSAETGFSGTFPFISPEQILGRGINEQTDIYALGIIFYQLFTGKLPFNKEHQAAQIFAMMQETPEPPSKFNKKLPPQLDHIVMHSLEKEPTDRYRSCNQILADLNKIILTDQNENKRSRLSVLILTTVILFLISATAVYLVSNLREAPVQIESTAQLTLPSPMQIDLDYFISQEMQPEAQIRIFSIIELLRERLSRIRGVQINAKAMPISPVENPGNQNTQRIHRIRVTLEGKNAPYNINIDAQFPSSPNIHFQYYWDKFDDILYLSSRIIADLLEPLLNRKVVIKNDSPLLQEKVKAFQYLAYGSYYLREQKYNLAISQYNKALQIAPFIPQAHFYKGIALEEGQRYSEAIEEFSQALPEALQEDILDWELIIPKAGGNRLRLGVVYNFLSNQNHSEYGWVYQKNKSSVLLVDLNQRKTISIHFPDKIRDSRLFRVYRYNSDFIFLVNDKSSFRREYRLVMYNSRQQSFTISKPIPAYPLPNPPDLFFAHDKLHHQLFQIDLHNNLKIIKLDLPIFGEESVYPLSQQNQYALVTDSNNALINLESGILSETSSLSDHGFHARGWKTLLSDIMLFRPKNKNNLIIYNFLNQQRIQSLNLIDNASGLEFFNKLPFYVKRNLQEFYVLSSDSFLNLYKIIDNSKIKKWAGIKLEKAPNTIIPLFSNRITNPHRIFFCSASRQFLIFNTAHGSVFRIGSEQVPKKFAFYEKGILFTQTSRAVIVIDSVDSRVIWRLPGSYTPVYNFKQASLLIFKEESGSRLAFYNYGSRKFLGFLQVSRAKNIRLKFLNNHFYYLEDNRIKGINFNALQTRNIVQETNIRYHIAKCYYLLNNYRQADREADRILNELNPVFIPALKLRANICTIEKRYGKLAGLVTRIYQLLSDQDPLKRKIEKYFIDSGLYPWKTFVELRQGKRILETDFNGILFADVKPRATAYLTKLNKISGKPIWQFPYHYRFFGIMISPNLFFYGESQSPSQRRNYYVLNTSDLRITQKLDGIFYAKLFPDFYKINEQKILIFFQYAQQSPARILVADLARGTIVPVVKRNHFITPPFIKDRTVFFISNDSLSHFSAASSQYIINKHALAKFRSLPTQIIAKQGHQVLIYLKNRSVYLWNPANRLPTRISIAEQILPRVGFINNHNQFFSFSRGKIEKVSLPNTIGIKRGYYHNNALYLIENTRLTIWRNQKIINQLPLLWSGIKYTFDGNRIFALNRDGRLFSINSAWNFGKVKNALIFRLE